MTGDNKTNFFYLLLAISSQNLPWHDHNFKHGREKLQKYHMTMTYVGHLVLVLVHLLNWLFVSVFLLFVSFIYLFVCLFAYFVFIYLFIKLMSTLKDVMS